MVWPDFIAGAVCGAAGGAFLAGQLYTRRLERVYNVPGAAPRATVGLPEPTPEQKLQMMGYSTEAVEALTRTFLEDAREKGVALSYEDAKTTALSAILDGAIPE